MKISNTNLPIHMLFCKLPAHFCISGWMLVLTGGCGWTPQPFWEGVKSKTMAGKPEKWNDKSFFFKYPVPLSQEWTMKAPDSDTDWKFRGRTQCQGSHGPSQTYLQLTEQTTIPPHPQLPLPKLTKDRKGRQTNEKSMHMLMKINVNCSRIIKKMHLKQGRYHFPPLQWAKKMWKSVNMRVWINRQFSYTPGMKKLMKPRWGQPGHKYKVLTHT